MDTHGIVSILNNIMIKGPLIWPFYHLILKNTVIIQLNLSSKLYCPIAIQLTQALKSNTLFRRTIVNVKVFSVCAVNAA